jgi:hypothetical protein
MSPSTPLGFFHQRPQDAPDAFCAARRSQTKSCHSILPALQAIFPGDEALVRCLSCAIALASLHSVLDV